MQKATNKQILDTIHANASPLYKMSVPQATRTNIKALGKRIMKDRSVYNEFMNALINVIGTITVQGMDLWENPLKGFKRGKLEAGGRIEDIYVGMVNEETWYANEDYSDGEIWKRNLPPVESLFYETNRTPMYEVSVNHSLLGRAFLSDTGLSDFVAQLMAAPQKRDEYNEFLSMTSLFADYNDNNGFNKIHLPNINSLDAAEADIKQALKVFQATAGNMSFPDTKFNALKVFQHSKRDKMHLFITPECLANINVGALAVLFNMDKAEIPFRIHEIRQQELNITNAQAILVDEKFFVCVDTLYENTSIQNPKGLYWNYFLHHHEIISYSLFANAVLFTSDNVAETDLPTSEIVSITDVNITDVDGQPATELQPGFMYRARALAKKKTGSSEVLEDMILYTIDDARSQRTYCTPDGDIRIGRDEPNGTIHLTAKAFDSKAVSKTIELTVKGKNIDWPSS